MLLRNEVRQFFYIGGMMVLSVMFSLQVLDHLVIQKLNAEGKLEKKETKKGSLFDKVWNSSDKVAKSDRVSVRFCFF